MSTTTFSKNAYERTDRNPFGRWFHASSYAFTIDHGFRGLIGSDVPELVWTIPDFQRPLVWTLDQKVRFIESVWAGLPIAAYVYDQAPDSKTRTLLDGQQRWNAILGYVSDEFTVHGLLFSEVEESYRRSFGMTGFPALVTNGLSYQRQKDVYERLAYGGTPHTPKVTGE